MADREDVIERLKKVSRYFKSMLKVGYDGDSDVYTEHRESVKMAIELLKEQKGLMLALEQSNAVNEYLNAEVERMNGLLKEQEAVEPKVIRMNGFGYPVHACVKCMHSITESMNYCSWCGQAVKWNADD